jgi:integrase
LGWAGANPVSLMPSSERPKPSKGKRRRVFECDELEQTIAAADEPYRILFTVAALTGARPSELLAITWANVCIDNIDDAEIEFAHQVDRRGNLAPTKTDGSAQTLPIPPQLARILVEHRQRASFLAGDNFVFAARSGRPFGQRNIGRALRVAQVKAVDREGNPPSRSCTSATSLEIRCWCRTGPCRRCTASGTRWRAERCWRARAWTRSPSCSVIGTPT